MRDIIFSYGWEPVLIHQILIGFEAIRESNLLFLFSGKRRYNIKLWKTFTDCFNCLPVAAIGKIIDTFP